MNATQTTPTHLDSYLLADRSDEVSSRLVLWWHVDLDVFNALNDDVDALESAIPERDDMVAWVYARLTDGVDVELGWRGVTASHGAGGRWAVCAGDAYPTTHYRSAYTAAQAAVDAFLATWLD